MSLPALESEEKVIILFGGPFLKKYLSIFDRESRRIGFAAANHAS